MILWSVCGWPLRAAWRVFRGAATFVVGVLVLVALGAALWRVLG